MAATLSPLNFPPVVVLNSHSSQSLLGPNPQAIFRICRTALERLLKCPTSLIEELPPSFFTEEISGSDLRASIPFSDDPFWALLDDRLFAHIHGDREIGGTNLEGHKIEITATFMIEYLERFCDKILKKDALELLKTLLFESANPEHFMERITQLQPGDKGFLMRGGWRGASGHAVVYHFVKRADGNYDIYIYNTGGGTLKFHSLIASKEKRKIHPIVYYEGVTPEELCFPSSALIAKLLQLRDPSYFEKEVERPDLIYDNVFGHLNHKRAMPPQDPICAMTGQRSGTCSWRVLLPLVCMFLGDMKKYKLWRFELQFITMVVYFQKNEGALQSNETSRLLLRNVPRNMQLTAAKLFGSQLISEQQVCKVLATCRELSQRIQKIEHELQNKPLVRGVADFWPKQISLFPKAIEDALIRAGATLAIPSALHSSVTSLFPNMELSRAPPPHLFPEFLGNFCKSLPEFVETDRFGAACCIEKFCRIIPINPEYWQNIPRDYVTMCLKNLDLVANSYAQIMLQPEANLPQQQNTAMSLCAFIHQLALAVDRNSLASFPIDIDPFLRAGQDPKCIFFRREDFDRRQELLFYFIKFNQGRSKPTLFRFQSRKYIGNKTAVNWMNNPLERLAEDLYFSGFLKNSEKLENAIKELRLQNPKCNVEVLRVAVILSETTQFRDETNRHAYILQNACFLAALFSGQASLSLPGDNPFPIFKIVDAFLESPEMISISYRYGKGCEINDLFSLSCLNRMHRSKNPAANELLIHPEFERREESLPSEARALVGFPALKKNQAFYDVLLACSQCEPKLQPQKIVYYFREHVFLLEDPDIQTLFDLIFFKMTTKQGREAEHVFMELQSNPQLLKLCTHLIELGLNHYCYRRPNNRPQVFAALFFVRLAQRLKKLCPHESEIPETLPILNEWLSRSDFAPEELEAIHLHRAYAYTLIPGDRLTESDFEALMLSWIETLNLQHHPHWEEADLFAAVRDFIYSYVERLSKVFHQNHAALNSILKARGLDDRLHEKWRGNFPHYRVDLSQNAFWEINLLTGKIASEGGLVSFGQIEEVASNQAYIRLFGTQRFHTTVINEFIYFIHPQYGRVRIRIPLKLSGGSKKELVIQRMVDEDWFQYIPPELLENSQVPLVLLADHTHWMPILQKGSRPHVMYAYDQETHKLAFEFNSEIGIRRGKDPILSLDNACRLGLSIGCLDRFERNDCIIFQLDGSNQNLPVEQILLPRYESRSGEILRFQRHNERLLWSENQSFSLVKTERAQSVLGNFFNIILLEDESGNFKALVPIRDLLQNDCYGFSCSLDVGDSNPRKDLSLLGPQYLLKQNRIHRYLEFNVNGSELIPLSQDGQFFLAYLHFARKEYEKAVAIFERFPKSDVLSPQCEEILQMIVSATDFISDSSPSSAALRLQAALIIATDKQRVREKSQRQEEVLEQTKRAERLVKYVASAAGEYRRAPSKVPESLRLSRNDWDLLQGLGVAPMPQHISITRLAQDPRMIKCHPKNCLEKYNPDVLDRRLYLNSFNGSDWQNAQNQRLIDLISWSQEAAELSSDLDHISKVFGWFYSQALKLEVGSSGRESLIHQIDLFHQFDQNSYNPHLCVSSEEIYQWIHLALRYPEKAPPLPLSLATWKEKIEWIETTRKIFCECLEIDKSVVLSKEFRLSNVEPLPDPVSTLSLAKSADLVKDSHPLPKEAQLFELSTYSPLGLSALAEKHMVEGPLFKSVLIAEAPPSWIEHADAPTEDQAFLDAIRAEFEEFGKDFLAGQKVNAGRFMYRFCSHESMNCLKESLEKSIEMQRQRTQQWTQLIVSLANRGPDDSQRGLMKALLHGGGYLKRLTVEDCVNFFCRKAIKNLSAANSNLSSEDIQTLLQLTEAYLIDACELDQAERAKKMLDQAQKKIGTNANREEIDLLIHQVGLELHARPFYRPSKRPEMLVFEYRAKMRMRKSQVELIEKICAVDPDSNLFNDIIIQLMMGGGKTTVIASLVLMLTADGTHIPIFTAPAAQYESLKHNLSATQKVNFDQTLRPIDLPRSLFTIENLIWIREQIELAEKLREPLLLKSEKIQALELELLTELDKASVASSLPSIDSSMRKLNELQRINWLISKRGKPLWDEVDVLMIPNRETNFPIGTTVNLEVDQVGLLRDIFEHLTSDALMIDGQSVNSIVRLRQNRSSAMTLSTFRLKVAPAIAKALAETREDLLLTTPDMRDGFIRFATGQMASHALEKDKEFLETLQKMHDSLQEEERDAAGLMCLAKHFLCTSLHSEGTSVLASTLKKSAGQHFGRSRGQTKVVPFLGVDAPAPTEFGDPWEAAAFHFMTACTRGIDPGQIHDFAMELHSAAERSLRKREDISFDETQEAQEFFQLTGVLLSQIKTEGALQKATTYVNQDIRKALSLEAETVCKEVTFFPEYVSSNPQDLGAQFSKGSRAGITGTPFNFPCYPSPLNENIIWDPGVDGSIAEQLLTRAKRREKSVVILEEATVAKIMEKGLEINPAAFRGVGDSSGIFKDFNNETIAREMLFFLKDHPTIDTVLFFGRKHSSDILPDHLMALRKGMEKPIFIGSTRKEELAKIGLTPDKYFTFFDERRCEATDISLRHDAFILITVDEKITLRSVSQTTLRARNFFMGQDVIFAVLKDSQPQLVNGGNTVEDVLRTALKNQAVRVGRDAFRASKQGIRAAIRRPLLERILEMSVEEAPAFFKQHREFFVSCRSNNPFNQYFELENYIDSLKSLELYRNKWIELFKSKNLDPKLLEIILRETESILKYAAHNRFFPSVVPQTQSDSQGTEIEIELQLENEIETAQEQELELELQNELQCYTSIKLNDSSFYKEVEWTNLLADAMDFPEVTIDYHSRPNTCLIFALNGLMRDGLPAGKGYEHPYYNLFADNLLITKNCALTINEYLPVFHRLQKPAHQLLLRLKQNKLLVIFLSIHEAAFFKDYLAQKKREDMWMIFPDGQEISSHQHVESEDLEEQLKDALIQVNFFSGNARYLDFHENETRAFLATEPKDLKTRFLKLRVEQDKGQRAVYYRSEALNPDGVVNERQTLHLRNAEKEMAKMMGPSMTPEKIATIPPQFVRLITNGHHIQYLKTKEQIQALGKRQVPFVTIDQVPMLRGRQIHDLGHNHPELINAVPDDMLKELHPRQIQTLGADKVKALQNDQLKYLALFQIPFVQNDRLNYVPDSLIQGVSENQVEHLPPHRLKCLVKPEQIKRIPANKIPYPDMPDVHLESFDSHQLDALPSGIIRRFMKETTVSRIPPKQLVYVPDDLLNSLIPAQVPHLPPYLFCLLTKPLLIQAVPNEHVSKLNKTQVKHLSADQVPHASFDQIPYLEGEQVKFLGNNQQKINNVAVAELNSLTDQQLALLDVNKIGYPVEWVVVPRLPSIQLPRLPDRLLKFITPDQVRHLKPAQLSKLTKPKLIQAVPNWRVGELIDAQVQHLLGDQVLHVPLDQIRLLRPNQIKCLVGFENQERIQRLMPFQFCDLLDSELGLLSSEQIKEIGEDLVPKLPIGHIGHLLDKHIPHVAVEQVGFVNVEQVRYLVKPQQIRAVPLDKVQGLTKQQRLYLSLDQIKHFLSLGDPEIQKELVPRLHAPEDILQVPEKQYHYLSPEQARIRFGGPVQAVAFAIIGTIGWMIRILSYLVLVPFVARHIRVVGVLDDAISSVARRLQIALRIWGL